jgi:hypothetical protein
MQSVSNQCQRTKQAATDNLDNHHRTTQRNNHPGSALVFLVGFAQKDVIVRCPEGGVLGIAHAFLT